MKSNNRVRIFDTTLRDGEQALRRSLSKDEKLQLAKAIAKLNVDVMEVGFPASSPGDFASVELIAKEIQGPTICALARAVPEDVIACGEALKPAQHKRIHIFIATSPIHLEKKLNINLQAATDKAVEAISIAKEYTDDIEFGCEDATRTPPEDLCYIIEKAIAAGATTVNLADTVGYTTPKEFHQLLSHIKANVSNIDQAILSVHCHNDLGLAVANSAESLLAGVRQIECTVNGIGERAGNCALEEITMLLSARKDLFGLYTNIKTELIKPTSELVSSVARMPVQLNKAVVGGNAFAHSSGIHQDGVIKSSITYEIFHPEQVGISKNELYFTARSGRKAIAHFLTQTGCPCEDQEVNNIYNQFLQLADKKGQVYWYDLTSLYYKNKVNLCDKRYSLVSAITKCASERAISVNLVLQNNQKLQSFESDSTNLIEALQNLKITNEAIIIRDLSLEFAPENFIYNAKLSITLNNKPIYGEGYDEDPNIAIIKSYISILNIINMLNQIREHQHSLQSA